MADPPDPPASVPASAAAEGGSSGGDAPASAAADAAAGSYYQTCIPPDVATRLESGAFRSLCSHLRDRSDEVQNIDLMTLSGFCRNCLAKWLVLEARKMSDEMTKEGGETELSNEKRRIVQALDALGYDETAEEVYGCTYPEWKKRHAKKASDETMEKYNNSKPLHAEHDKSLLAVRADKSIVSMLAEKDPIETKHAGLSGEDTCKPSLLSDVCCEDVDSLRPTSSAGKAAMAPAAQTSTFVAPSPPEGAVALNVGILTVSDRAAAGQYESGDLSGLAVERSLEEYAREIHAKYPVGDVDRPTVDFHIIARAIVPDEVDYIQRTLQLWSRMPDEGEVDADVCDLILTTGGTGFSPRDVTPEATRAILDRESRGLMSWVSSECSAQQPLASLSRGTAGTCGKTLIANLPGSPAGVAQVMKILLPLLVHAVKDVQAG